jgi:hypothetical protein
MILDRSVVAGGIAGSADSSGVRYRHENGLFRAFRGAQSDVIRRLVDAPDLSRIFDAGLVSFGAAQQQLEGFDLTVEIHRVPVVTYPTEWPICALKDAALTFLDVVIALGQAGFGVKDGHPWNLLFEDRRPVFVDLGSITGSPTRSWVREFQTRFAVPLALHRRGIHGTADRILADHRGAGANKLFSSSFAMLFPKSLLRAARSRDPLAAAAVLRDWVMELPISGRTMTWSGYDQQSMHVTDLPSFSPKQRAVHSVLAETKPGSVLDMAANAGWYSELAEALGHRVIAADVDDAALGKLYGRLAGSIARIDCAKLDFVWPTGSQGMGLVYSEPYERLRCDTVLALAVLHHLAGHQGVTFGMFASIIDQLATHRAVVEFVPSDDEHVKQWSLAREPWYRQEELVDAFSPYFPQVRVIPSSPDPRRLLVFDR